MGYLCGCINFEETLFTYSIMMASWKPEFTQQIKSPAHICIYIYIGTHTILYLNHILRNARHCQWSLSSEPFWVEALGLIKLHACDSSYVQEIHHKPLSFCIRLELGNPGLEASADARARTTRINITHLEEDGGGRRPYSLYRSYTDLCMVYLSGVHRYIYVACAIHILMCYIQLAIQQCILS